MIRPFATTTDDDLRLRAAALRGAAYQCMWCHHPRIDPLAIEVYANGGDPIFLCYRCSLVYRLCYWLLSLPARWTRRTP